MTGPSGAPRSEGLAEERTQLAWGRNGLALVVCAVALLKRAGPLAASGQRPVAGMLVVTMGSTAWAITAALRRRRRADERAEDADVRLVAYSTAAIGVVALIVSCIPE